MSNVLINLENAIRDAIQEIADKEQTNPRNLALAKTNFEQGLMWLRGGVGDDFWYQRNKD